MKQSSALIIGLFSMVLSVSGNAKSNESTPDELGLFVDVASNCPFTIAQINDVVEGEFLRARLKPSEDLSLNLNVNVACLQLSNTVGTKTGYAVNYEIRYGTRLENDTDVLYETPNFGNIMVGGMDASSSLFFIDTVRNATSSALNDYLKATMGS